MTGRLLLAAGGVAGAVVALLLLTWLMQRRLIYFPLTAPVMAASDLVPGGRDVQVVTGDGLELAGWWIPARGVPAVSTVIVFNGNAGDRSMRAPLAAGLSRRGHHVLLFDYRGYGGNDGAPSAVGLARDASAALETARSLGGAAPPVYLGESLGAAVALELAVRHPPAALVLRSPFTSLVDVARLHYPFLPAGLLLRDRYPSARRVGELSCPLLVVAGDADRIVPAAQSRTLFEAAPEPKEWLLLPGLGHNDPELNGGRRMLEAVDRFIRANVDGEPDAPAPTGTPGRDPADRDDAS